MSSPAEFGIAIIGCGTVGNATARLLIDSEERYTRITGKRLTIKALISRSYTRARLAGLNESLFSRSIDEVLTDPTIHLIVETVGGLTDARDIIRKSLKAHKHVVTANKALLAHHGAELFALARENKVSIGFESSCAGGIPIIRALADGLRSNTIDALYGIVNGTSNFILTEMVDNGKTYQEALGQAQAEGIAEANPSLDVNGTDAAHKLTLLASLAFGGHVPIEAIPTEGIEGLDLFDIITGQKLGYVLKLVAFARKADQGLELAVKPAFLLNDHPLSLISGTFNAVSVYGTSVGHTMYYGRGAGGSPTASAVVSDIISIAVGTWPTIFTTLPLWPDNSNPVPLVKAKEAMHRHYLRFDVEDRSGVIADITAEMARKNISLSSFVQKEYHRGKLVPIVIITHEARVKDIDAAFESIKSLPTVGDGAVNYRIIDEHAELL